MDNYEVMFKEELNNRLSKRAMMGIGEPEKCSLLAIVCFYIYAFTGDARFYEAYIKSPLL